MGHRPFFVQLGDFSLTYELRRSRILPASPKSSSRNPAPPLRPVVFARPKVIHVRQSKGESLRSHAELWLVTILPVVHSPELRCVVRMERTRSARFWC